MDMQAFQNALQVDPAIALKPVPITARTKTGPLHRLQFVIEFVGPRSVPAAGAAAILSPQWYAALGEPGAWSMSAADKEWQPLSNSTSGSYDSLALSWDLVSPKGSLSQSTASHLLATAEQLAGHLNRRAIPLPHPNDIPQALAEVSQLEENFDGGFSLVVLPRARSVAERDLWVWCAKLGLTFGSSGTFDWMVPGSTLPLFSASPLGGDESFSLRGVQAGSIAEGVLLGFRIPLCPAPISALEGMFYAAEYFARAMDGTVYDESDRPLDDRAKKEYRSALAQVVGAMERAKIAPGSSEALHLFRD